MSKVIRLWRSLAELPDPMSPLAGISACTSDACRSGDIVCPTQQACQLAEADAKFQRRSTAAVAVMLVLALVCTITLASARALPGDDVVTAEAAMVCSAGASR